MRYFDNEKHQIDSRTYSRSKVDQKRLQKEDICIARELGYPAIVIKMLEDEPDQYKRQHILTDARTGKYDKKRKR